MIKFIKTVLILSILTHSSCESQGVNYVCPPCDLACDSIIFKKDGICPHCSMNLIMNTDTTMVNQITIKKGSGNFLIEGGSGHKEKRIKVFYHSPSHFNKDSKVLILLPGAGRNANDYRDAWIHASETYNILVLSLEYSETFYPQFWNYNLAGMLTDVKINDQRTAMTDFKINNNSNQWIFNDFDRIFNLVKNELKLRASHYDMFGHSAGGQLLQRLAIFKPESRAHKIMASNAGWYTLPDPTVDFPLGLKNIHRNDKDLNFNTHLVLLLGEKDDASETRGHLRRSPQVDQQGLHRLARGKYFYQNSKTIAKHMGKQFNWKLEIIPNVGHDFKAMSKAAARYLYN